MIFSVCDLLRGAAPCFQESLAITNDGARLFEFSFDLEGRNFSSFLSPPHCIPSLPGIIPCWHACIDRVQTLSRG